MKKDKDVIRGYITYILIKGGNNSANSAAIINQGIVYRIVDRELSLYIYFPLTRIKPRRKCSMCVKDIRFHDSAIWA